MNIYEYELYGRYTFEKGGTGKAPMSFTGFMQVLKHRLANDSRKDEMVTKELQMEIAIEMGRE